MPIYDAVYRIGETEESISISTIESHPEFYEVKKKFIVHTKIVWPSWSMYQKAKTKLILKLGQNKIILLIV
ncbi:hypothetical protein ASL14_06165 [Paenibacillus sp. IHB B 3084]|uniref:hypothetical protein n=1 Tax=Paenibacillus sp. IHB B 3084 TaxID=867076 RepID=UPI00071F366F|nr:hypothetical protein [Paenibacillus sp. IHB B 3084]ALP35814.1 hypothetical protein ASL14_06165 [Paenibacillus sp. IHB B 3084]